MPTAFPIMHIRMDIPYCWSFLQASYPPLFETLRALISVAAAWHRAVIKPWAAIGNQGLAASPLTGCRVDVE